MPNKLYYDSQSMVKTAVMNIAKQQKLDSDTTFSFLNLGDDALELLFAFLRMSGGHNNAVNYRQAVDQLGAARDIGGVFARQSLTSLMVITVSIFHKRRALIISAVPLGWGIPL